MNKKTDRKEYLKKYAEEHKEERRKRAREYYYNNREKRKEYDKQRRLKIKNNPELNQKMKDYKREWTRENRKKQKEKINNLQSKIDKANKILEEILVVSDWEHEGRFRPVKGTTAQDVYKTIIKLNELLETPRKINYELLKEDK